MPRHRLPSIPSKEFSRFVAIVRRLRKECPWDSRQTHRSLREGLLEETYEVIETLDRGDMRELEKELGDLLLHVALHTAIAEEKREFAWDDVLRGINRKLIRRHPHVFGTAKAAGAKDVARAWEKTKLQEGRTSLLEGVPRAMPALQRALRVQQRASHAGFDWSKVDDVWAKVREEVEELRVAATRGKKHAREEEFGDFLFSLVNFSRFLGINPEHALRATVDKFTTRFQYIETELRRQGRDIHGATLAEMDVLWTEAKKRRRSRS
jgi:MazG family protein